MDYELRSMTTFHLLHAIVAIYRKWQTFIWFYNSVAVIYTFRYAKSFKMVDKKEINQANFTWFLIRNVYFFHNLWWTLFHPPLLEGDSFHYVLAPESEIFWIFKWKAKLLMRNNICRTCFRNIPGKNTICKQPFKCACTSFNEKNLFFT